MQRCQEATMNRPVCSRLCVSPKCARSYEFRGPLRGVLAGLLVASMLFVSTTPTSAWAGPGCNPHFGPSAPSGGPPIPATGSHQRLAVPSYFRPTAADADGLLWSRLEGGFPTVGLAIINPSSGPGATKDQAYVT